jgi:DNA-directed RNA polymerase specialized sigma24 family protein
VPQTDRPDISAAVARLSDPEYGAVMLRAQGATLREIAAFLGVDVHEAAQILANALRQLKIDLP